MYKFSETSLFSTFINERSITATDDPESRFFDYALNAKRTKNDPKILKKNPSSRIYKALPPSNESLEPNSIK